MRLAHIPENADYKFHWNVYSGKKKKKKKVVGEGSVVEHLEISRVMPQEETTRIYESQ